jgi:hypothetical protein
VGIVSVIAAAYTDDPVVASQAANYYRAFIAAFGKPQSVIIARAVKSSVKGVQKYFIPLLEERSTLDQEIKQYFLKWEDAEALVTLAARDPVRPHDIAHTA